MAVTVRSILSDLSRVEGIRGCAVVSKDGFIIENVLPSDCEVDSDELAVMVTTVYGTVEMIGSELKVGGIDLINIEFDESYLLIQDLGEALLVVLSDKQTPLGKVRFEVKKHRDKLKEALIS